MRKFLSVLLAAVSVAGASAAAAAADGFLDFDDRGGPRGERRYLPPPPPAPPVRREAPPPRVRRVGQGEPYFFFSAGGFEPNDGRDGLSGYDSGGSLWFGFGARVSPLFALEGAFGGYSSERGGDEATVVPLTIGGRLIIPNPFFEPYIGGGVGLYRTELKEAPVGSYPGIDDEQSDLGGYFSIGSDIRLSDRFALNLEGAHHWVKPEFIARDGSPVEVDLSGWTLNVGLRFSF
jgi:opacity protein-like surface antigen